MCYARKVAAEKTKYSKTNHSVFIIPGYYCLFFFFLIMFIETSTVETLVKFLATLNHYYLNSV